MEYLVFISQARMWRKIYRTSKGSRRALARSVMMSYYARAQWAIERELRG